MEQEITIQTYLLFIQHESPRLLCLLGTINYSRLKAGINFEDPELAHPKSFEMNQPQIYRG